jgi:ribulose-phosphate 3-epimerase
MVITVHYEACTHLHRTVQAIQSRLQGRCSLKSTYTSSLLKDILADLDLVLIMSVNPGFGGQQFIPQSLNKIVELRKMANEINPNLLIEVDGGVSISNIGSLINAGANAFVAGNAIFAAENPTDMIANMKNIDITSNQI